MAYSGFTIPAEASATQASQSGLDPLEVQAVGAAIQGYGVLSGCAVVQHAAGANMTVDVASGTISTPTGAPVTVSSGTTGTITAADATNDRYTLVVAAYATGVVSLLDGAAAAPADSSHAGPLWPAAFDPTTYAVLAELFVQHAATSITTALITDKRLIHSASYVLTPTAVKTANYTAVAFDFVPCDTATTGSFTVTLPNAPADKTLVGVEQVAQSGTRAVTVACAGSDVFDVASGATTKLLTMLGQGSYLQYKASSAIWYTVANRQPVIEIPTAKGDLLVATASGVLARQAVGADSNFLTADSTQTGGVGWVPPLFAKPTAALYETFARAAAATTSFLVSGTLQLSAIMLPSGLVVTSISFATASTALAAGTTPHLWFALYDSSLALLRQSTDDTSPVWAANTLKTYNLSSAFTTTYSGLHYIGMMNANASGGTLPALVAAAPGTAIVGLAPNLGGTSSTAQTTTAPNPAAAITAAKLVYGYVS